MLWSHVDAFEERFYVGISASDSNRTLGAAKQCQKKVGFVSDADRIVGTGCVRFRAQMKDPCVQMERAQVATGNYNFCRLREERSPSPELRRRGIDTGGNPSQAAELHMLVILAKEGGPPKRGSQPARTLLESNAF